MRYAVLSSLRVLQKQKPFSHSSLQEIPEQVHGHSFWGVEVTEDAVEGGGVAIDVPLPSWYLFNWSSRFHLMQVRNIGGEIVPNLRMNGPINNEHQLTSAPVSPSSGSMPVFPGG